MSHAAVFITVRIVDGLHAASAWGIIFRSRDFHLPVVWERPDRLHKSLSVASLAHDGGAVHVLKGSRHNLRR